MAIFLDKIKNRAASSLMEHPDAMRYLESERKIPRTMLDSYFIGYTESLTVQSDGSPAFEEIRQESRDFRGLQRRVLFPVSNCIGGTVGFSTRRIKDAFDDSGKKLQRYKTFMSSESKTVGAFFGFEQAMHSMVEKGFVYVTEGAVDCMSLSLVFPNVISSLTSALTDSQAWVLSMLVDKVVLVFDTDEPGRIGARKAMEFYGEKFIKSMELGYHDANLALTTLGYPGFKKYAENKLKFTNFKAYKV